MDHFVNQIEAIPEKVGRRGETQTSAVEEARRCISGCRFGFRRRPAARVDAIDDGDSNVLSVRDESLEPMPQAPALLVPGEQATRTFRPASELSVGCADQFLNYRLLLFVRLSRKLSEFASNLDLVHESNFAVEPAGMENR